MVRYCASERKICKPHIQELLEGPLGDCAVRGRAMNWAAVRRRENEAADEAATEGVYMAARLAEQGDTPITRITDYEERGTNTESGRAVG